MAKEECIYLQPALTPLQLRKKILKICFAYVFDSLNASVIEAVSFMNIQSFPEL